MRKPYIIFIDQFNGIHKLINGSYRKGLLKPMISQDFSRTFDLRLEPEGRCRQEERNL